MADKKNEAQEVPAGIVKADVLKLLRDNKIEVIGRKGVVEHYILSFADLGQTVVVVTADGRKHTLNK